ncbi:putative reverse transcriptase domain-containing protein [Tanacetum coccineum]
MLMVETVGMVEIVGIGGNNGCTYKGFMSCNLKEYDGKGGAITLTRWIEKMENMVKSQSCQDIQLGFMKLAKLVPHIVTPESIRIRGYIAGQVCVVQLTKVNEKRKEWKSSASKGKEDIPLFTVDLIPLGHGSFDVIMGMDWLSEHKAKIVCHEKVVRIPLESGEILHV